MKRISKQKSTFVLVQSSRYFLNQTPLAPHTWHTLALLDSVRALVYVQQRQHRRPRGVSSKKRTCRRVRQLVNADIVCDSVCVDSENAVLIHKLTRVSPSGSEVRARVLVCAFLLVAGIWRLLCFLCRKSFPSGHASFALFIVTYFVVSLVFFFLLACFHYRTDGHNFRQVLLWLYSVSKPRS